LLQGNYVEPGWENAIVFNTRVDAGDGIISFRDGGSIHGRGSDQPNSDESIMLCRTPEMEMEKETEAWNSKYFEAWLS